MRAALAYVGLGANLADRVGQLRRAAVALDGAPRTRVRRRSSIYETAPVGGPPQGRYLNAVLELETQLAPLALLEQCLAIEGSLGRTRTGGRDEPRPIDLDILLYGDEVIAERRLVVPHGRLHERAFALVPLVEIEPNIEHPALGRQAATLLRRLPATSVVRTEETW